MSTRWIAAVLVCIGALAATARLRAQEAPAPPLKQIVSVRMSDGVDIAVALYKPEGAGPFPALLAASPYRLDNDEAPSLPIFPFRETGPIGWYRDRGYAFVRVDVRGTGRSGGEYRYQDAREQRDLYEIVEWIAAQPWSNGKVGGIGQSYYARSQWFAAVQAPPHLACVAPYDGNIDTYRSSAYTGGVPGMYPAYWFNFLRSVNMAPFAGEPRELTWDYGRELTRHRTYDAFWEERAAAPRLSQVKIPVFSIGVWGKVDLHLNGNIVGFQRVAGPKKLLVLGGAGVDAAVAEFSSPAFHERYLLPFYDWCLKGLATSYASEPAVRYTVTGSNELRAAADWPPSGAIATPFYLTAGPSGAVASINDGGLAASPPTSGLGETKLVYPQPGWGQTGVVAMGPDGRPDTARRVLTFTSGPLERPLEIAGPILLKLAITSSRNDADLIVRLYEQMAQSADERARGAQPQARLVTKGWLRASHRATDEALSRDNAPWYKDDAPEPLVPGRATDLDIAIMPTATLFRAGSRVRIEIANSDSILTEGIFSHVYNPDQVGVTTILHDAAHPSRLILPVIAKPD